MATQYTNLCEKLEKYIQDLKIEESKEDRLELVQEIERVSIKILEQMKREEQRGISKALKMDKWFYRGKRKERNAG